MGYVLVTLEVIGSVVGDFCAVLATLPVALWAAVGVLLVSGLVLVVLDQPGES